MIRRSSGKTSAPSAGLQVRLESLDFPFIVGETASVNETSEPTSVAALTAEVVSAYVSNNKVAPSDLAMLISNVASEMAMIGTAVELMCPAARRTVGSHGRPAKPGRPAVR